MAKRFVFLLGLLALILPITAQAQVGPGGAYIYCFNTANNPSWQPCSSANPVPVVVQSGGGTSSTNIAQVNGQTVDVGTGAAGLGTQRTAIATDSFPAQGSTTSGQTGPLVQGKADAVNPTTTAGSTWPLSLTPAGSLRVGVYGKTGGSTEGSAPVIADNNALRTAMYIDDVNIGDSPLRSIRTPAANGGNTLAIAIAPTSATGGGITPIVSASAENNHVLKNSAGNLYSAYAANITATAGYLVILNSTTSPGDGAITPLAVCNLPANGTCSINFNPGPAQVYSTGITAVVTSASTPFTKTTGTITAFISGSVM